MAVRRVRFTRARAAGWTELSGGILADHPRGHDLPGPMAPLVALSAEDGRGGKQGLLWDRHTGWLTAILRVSPVGLDLADPAQADAWVAGWAALLANLGFLPLVRHIAVTVDTCPAGGTTLRDYVTARIDPAAPAPARAVLDELLAATPTISADVDTRVAVTFDPARATPKPADLLAAVAEVVRWLPGIEASLAGCGVALQGRAECRLVDRAAAAGLRPGRPRRRHPPHRPGRPRRASGVAVVERGRAGPRAGKLGTLASRLRHLGGVGDGRGAPPGGRRPGADPAAGARPVPAPGHLPLRALPGRAGRRTRRTRDHQHPGAAVLGRPHPPRRNPTRPRHGPRAQQSAREEAEGAGVGRFCLYVSTTLAAGAERYLPAAAADVEQRAGMAKLRLRRLNGAHAGGFAAALGLGLDPTELAHRTRR